jgi:hypothetical protein
MENRFSYPFTMCLTWFRFPEEEEFLHDDRFAAF